MDNDAKDSFDNLSFESDKAVKALKQLSKKIKEENKKAVEKIRNTDLEEKRRIVNAIVNLDIIIKLIKEDKLFDPIDNGGELTWIYPDGKKLSLIDAVDLLRKKLNR